MKHPRIYGDLCNAILYAIAVALLLVAIFQPLSASAQVIFPARGGTGTSTIPTYGKVLVGNGSGTYSPMATSSLGIGGFDGGTIDTESELEAFLTDVLNVFTNNDGALSDDNLSNNSTSDLAEGANLYYSDARARQSISESILGLGYDNSTGVLSLTSGYVIPLTASTSEWATAYGWGNHAAAGYLTSAAGDWIGTFDGQEGSWYRDRANHTGTQLASTISNFASTVAGLIAGTTTDAFNEGSTNRYYTDARVQTFLDTITKGYFFSTTSADYWETQQGARTADDLTNNSIEDLSDVAAITENYGDLLFWNGSAWADLATSSLGYTPAALSANGSNCSAGSAAGGVSASGVAEDCTDYWTEAENAAAAYAPQSRTITIDGTANQVTSSAAAQSLAANRTWTLSLPSHVIFPSSFFATRSTTTHATSTNFDITNLLTFGGITGNSWDDFCTSITGGASLCDGTDATGSGTVATSTTETAGQLAVWTSTGATPALLGKVATSTIAFTGPFSGTSALGTLVGGSNSTIVWTGLATTSQPASSNLLVSNGGTGVFGVATTSLSGNSQIALSQPVTVIGASASTLSIVGDSIGDTQLAFNTGQNLTTASSPTFANLTVNYASTTAVSSTALCISTDCRTAWPTGGSGLSTSSPVSSSNLLYYSGSGAGSAVGVATSSATLGLGLSGTLTTVGTGQSLSIATSSLYTGTTGQFPYFSGTNTVTATSSLFIATSGRIGVGSTTPGSDLSVGSTNGINLYAGASTTATSTFPGNIKTGGRLVFENNGQTNTIQQHRLGFLDIKRTGSDWTLTRCIAHRECTHSLVIDRDDPAAGVNEEFVDFYNENYSDSRQWGFRQAFSGTGTGKPFVIGFWQTSAAKDIGNNFIILPNGTAAFAQATSTIPTDTRLHISSSTATNLLSIDSTPGTRLLTLKNDGKLGIGTSSPSDQLTVSVGNNAGVRVSSSNSGFYDVGQGNGDRWRIQNNFTGTGLLEFLYNTGTGAAPATNLLTLTGTGSSIAGRVGIGSTTPWARLGITGVSGSTNPIFNVASSSNASYFTIYPTGTTTIAGPSAATSTQYMYSTAASKGAVIILEDIDGAGCTEIAALNGTLTTKTVTCPTEI